MKGQQELDKYLESLRANKRSPQTVFICQEAIKKLLEYIEKEPLEITQEDIENYKKYLGEDFEKSSMRTYLCIAKRFLQFLGKTKEQTSWKMPTVPQHLPDILTQEEARRLLDAAKENPRDYAIIAIFLYSGIRLSELRNLRISDINFESNTILIKQGKGDRDRFLPLHPDAKAAILRYLKYRADNGIMPKDNSDILFPGHKEPTLSIYPIARLIKERCAEAGIRKRITPHKLRHTALSQLYRATKDIRFVQKIAGHARIATTEIYVQTDVDYLKEVYAKAALNFTSPNPLPLYEQQDKKEKDKKNGHYLDYYQ